MVARPQIQKDTLIFWSEMLRSPFKIVAVSPSSEMLARRMAEGLGPETGPVIELGAGTGRLTAAILDRGVAEEDLTLFEINDRFASMLSERFPRARVVRWPAQDVDRTPAGQAGAVVSGLPLLSMSREAQRAIVGGAFRVLRPGGIFVQFTYGVTPPVEKAVRDEFALTWTKRGRVWRNAPPAQVYEFRKPA